MKTKIVVSNLTVLCLLMSLTLSFSAFAQNNTNNKSKIRMMGKGTQFGINDLPPGKLKSRIEKLPAKARLNAQKWLSKFEFPENDVENLQVDNDGAIFYIEQKSIGAIPTGTPEASSIQLPSSIDVFKLHSKQGSTKKVFIDFDGADLSKTAWSSNYGSPFIAKPYDADGSPSTFSDAERAAIHEIWHRVSEDLAPFDIDVTTEAAIANANTGVIMITYSYDANGISMPNSGGGGVAYIGVFGSANNAFYSPGLVYIDNLQGNPTYIAEAASHEFGHNLGLSHDGTSGSTYYEGHGGGDSSWAPIMGSAYFGNVTQWSKGEYLNANNTQDDIAIIQSKLGLRIDSTGDVNSKATYLLSSQGLVEVSNPQNDPSNLNDFNKGIINSRADIDVYAFKAEPGLASFTINPAWESFYRPYNRGANLDVKVRLLNSAGNELVVSDSQTATNAQISFEIPSSGVYYLEISGTENSGIAYSDYGSIGLYFISGSYTPSSISNVQPVSDFSINCTHLACNFLNSSFDPDGSNLTHSWNFGDGSSSNEINPTHNYLAAGEYKVILTVIDSGGLSASFEKSINVLAPPLVKMHIKDVLISSQGYHSKFGYRFTAEVRIVDQAGNPLAGVVVVGAYSGLISNKQQATSDASGVARFSQVSSANSGTVIFTVQSLQHGVYIYDQVSNVELSASLSLSGGTGGKTGGKGSR